MSTIRFARAAGFAPAAFLAATSVAAEYHMRTVPGEWHERLGE